MSKLNRREFKELTNEWISFLQKDMINEISLKRFKEQHPSFDTTNFSSQMKGNTDYLDIINNSINAGQNHSASDYIQQFDYYKNSIEPNRRNKEFLTIEIPGEDEPITLDGKITQNSCTATFIDIQQFQQTKMFILGKGNKNKLLNAYVRVLEEANTSDFELVAKNGGWIIFYPKSIRGSVALARSYWDGKKIAYDKTFQPHNGFGKNTGFINWCTSVTGDGNMFLNYHKKKNLHMYYCIKKKTSGIEDPNRKICISFTKKTKPKLEIQFDEGFASVDANNHNISEKYSKNILKRLFNNLLEDVKQEERLEIDFESYYRSISLRQYITMRKANEENIEDFINEVENILQHSKDSNKISNYAAKDSYSFIRIIAAENYNTSKSDLLVLAEDEDPRTRAVIAKREDLLELDPSGTLIKQFANDEDANVRFAIVSREDLLELDPSGTLIKQFANDKDPRVRHRIARRKDLLELDPSGTLIKQFANDEGAKVRGAIASREDLLEIDPSGEIVKKLVNDEGASVKIALAERKDLLEIDPSGEIVKKLANDNYYGARAVIASREDLLELDPSGTLIKQFANDEDSVVRSVIASREDLLEIDPSGEIVKKLANDEETTVRGTVAKRKDLLELDPTGEIVKKLANDNYYVKGSLEKQKIYVDFLSQVKKESNLIDYIKLIIS